ncbi:MAG: dihydroorotase, partial [Chloroflexota bacterium]
MKLLVRGGTVVTGGCLVERDVLCEDGRVVALMDPRGRPSADEAIEASGQLVFPGFIDPHIHARDPGFGEKEDFGHATRAAACGGVTTVFDMPNTIPPLSHADMFADRTEQHARQAQVDFGLWGMSLGQENLGEITNLISKGVVGIKLFWGYFLDRRTYQLVYDPLPNQAADLIRPPDDDTVRDLFRRVATAGGLLAAHCEDRDVIEAARARLVHAPQDYDELLASRPEEAEARAVRRLSMLAAEQGCRFHVVHVSSKAGVDEVRAA